MGSDVGEGSDPLSRTQQREQMLRAMAERAEPTAERPPAAEAAASEALSRTGGASACITVRHEDGQSTTLRLSDGDSVERLYAEVARIRCVGARADGCGDASRWRWRREREGSAGRFQLRSGFPPAPIPRSAQTLAAAGLTRAVVVVARIA